GHAGGAVRFARRERVNDSANGVRSGFRLMHRSGAVKFRPTVRSVNRVLRFRRAIYREIAQSPGADLISPVNAWWDHAVEFHFGIRIGRCTGSLGSPT
ncbi:hypothetical protein P0D68_34615, partial [Paraburkholderia sp. RL17-380-BIE-A]|uniref:hypothetical protein n=1 Tax=Paraburkholderia sp. RL17-380-BIE-A TaxID=3031630 RepID=UPI0038BE124A